MDNINDSRTKMQEADMLMIKITNLSNPSRPTLVNHLKSLQTQQLKNGIGTKDSNAVGAVLREVEEQYNKTVKRWEEIEPKSQQLVGIVKYVKESLAKESIGMQNSLKYEEERLANAKQELELLKEQMQTEQETTKKKIENARSQVIQMDLKLKTVPDGPIAVGIVQFTPQEEDALQQEENTLRALEAKLARVSEMLVANNDEFVEQHNSILDEIENVKKSIEEVAALNQAKQNELEQETKKSDEWETTNQELEKKLNALRE